MLNIENVDNRKVEFEYLRYLTGRSSLRNLQNRKSLAKQNKEWSKYVHIGLAILLIQAEMGQE